MALTPEIRATQAQTLTATAGVGEIRVTQAQAMGVINFPTAEMRVTQARTVVATAGVGEIRVTQAQVMAIARGQIDNRRVRAWGFSQDGHDFYVLQLGQTETLIYDATTGQWSEWDGADLGYWRTNAGLNWQGMAKPNYDGTAITDVVIGDNSYGLLWTLDPTLGYDEPVESTSSANAFTRAVRGGFPIRGRQAVRNNAVYLVISPGAPTVASASITLRTSDDQGNTWTDHDAILVTSSEWSQEIMWRSLGMIAAPGRIFEFQDNGGMVRIDGADIRVNGSDE